MTLVILLELVDVLLDLVETLLNKRHSPREPVMLLDLFFELFDTVIGKLGAYQNTAERAAERAYKR